jgi:hypothetical protein
MVAENGRNKDEQRGRDLVVIRKKLRGAGQALPDSFLEVGFPVLNGYGT